MLWVIIGISGVIVFAICAVLLLTGGRGNSVTAGESRPGYQEVIVRDAVDVSTQQYVYGVGAYFPNVDGIQSTPTVLNVEGAVCWNIVLKDTATGRKYRRTFSGQLLIGRDPASKSEESRLIIPDQLVSKNHCLVQSGSSSLTVQDLDSKNGTYVNGKRISAAVPLNSGDRLDIGRTSLEVQIFREN